MRLQNKVAVITGGNSGIGLGIAKEFQAEGASLAIMGRNRQTLDTTQQQLGQNTIVVQGDVSEMADIDALYETVTKQLGKIDILVVNAGTAMFVPIDQIDEATFDSVVNTNFKGAFFTIQKSLTHLNEGASIILIASATQSLGIPATSVYAATKAALRTLARTISADLLDRKIRVNVISPGPIDTPLFEKLGIPEEHLPQAKKEIRQTVALNRFATPKEVARVAVFLASSDSSYILGEEINVDGGATNLNVVNTT